MNTEILSPVWVEIDLSNLDHNIKEIQKKASPASLVGIVKADAYGHGMIEVTRVMKKNGIHTFAVAKLTEAIAFRRIYRKDELIILTLTADHYADILAEYDITPVVCSYDNAKVISDAAAKHGKVMNCYIAVDTGMGRI